MSLKRAPRFLWGSHTMDVRPHKDEDINAPNFREISYNVLNVGLGDIGKIKIEQGSTVLISRVELWKAGQKKKTGEYINKDAANLTFKIDELSSQESQSAETMSPERDDILASVLGKEHSGKVRAGGKFSTIKSFFKDDRRSEQRSVARIEVVEAIVQNRLSQQQELWSQQQQAHQANMSNMKNQIEELMRMFSVETGTVVSTSVALARETSQDISQIKKILGSGVMWDTEGHIVTNYHVIRYGFLSPPSNYMTHEVYILNSEGVEEMYYGELVGANRDEDFAILKIAPPK